MRSVGQTDHSCAQGHNQIPSCFAPGASLNIAIQEWVCRQIDTAAAMQVLILHTNPRWKKVACREMINSFLKILNTYSQKVLKINLEIHKNQNKTKFIHNFYFVAAHFSDEPLFDAVHWWGATSFFLLALAFLSLLRVLRVSSLFRVIACSGNRKQ